MREAKGELRMLGAGTFETRETGYVRYSVVEVGDTILNRMKTDHALSSYLGEGLGKNVIIHYKWGHIHGIEIENEKTYISKAEVKTLDLYLYFIFGFLTIPIFGAGFILLFMGFKSFFIWNDVKKLHKGSPMALVVS